MFDCQLVSDVVFVDVADIYYSLLSNVFGDEQLHVPEPDIRVEPLFAASFRRRAMRLGPAL